MERVLANPIAGHRWCQLFEQYDNASDEDLRQSVRRQVESQVSPQDIEGFFRATFLADVTGDIAFISEAGQIIQTIRPIDAERLMAFAIFEWGKAVVQEGLCSQFIATLRQAYLPEIMQLAGAHLNRKVRGSLALRTIDRVRKIALAGALFRALRPYPD